MSNEIEDKNQAIDFYNEVIKQNPMARMYKDLILKHAYDAIVKCKAPLRAKILELQQKISGVT